MTRATNLVFPAPANEYTTTPNNPVSASAACVKTAHLTHMHTHIHTHAHTHAHTYSDDAHRSSNRCRFAHFKVVCPIDKHRAELVHMCQQHLERHVGGVHRIIKKENQGVVINDIIVKTGISVQG